MSKQRRTWRDRRRGRGFTPGELTKPVGFVIRPPEEVTSGKPRKGEIESERRALAADIFSIWSTENKKGQIETPRFETVGGELGPLVRLDQTIPISSMPVATRRQWHKHVSGSAESERLWNAATAVAKIHNYIKDKGLPTNSEMRTRLTKKLGEIIVAFGKSPQKDSKKKAKEGLFAAIKMVENANVPAFLHALRGVHGNIGVRITALNRMNPKMKRTLQSAIRKLEERKREQYAWIRVTTEDADRIGSLSPADARAIIARYASQVKSIHRLLTPAKRMEGEKLISIFSTTIEQMRKGQMKQAASTLRAARPWQHLSMSREHILPSHVLVESRKWDRSLNHELVSRQLRLFGENIQFWSANPEHEWMIPWSYGLLNSLRLIPNFRSKRSHFERGVKWMEQGQFAQAKKEWEAGLA